MEIGKNINEFNIVKTIGVGGFGEVVEAVCKVTAIGVAIKIVKKTIENVQRAREECRIHKCLIHPAIVKMYKTFEDAEHVYMVMELCEGDLDTHIRQTPHCYSAREVARKMRPILEALIYLKDKYVIHRDIKLKNLMVARDGQIKLGDFGVAAVVTPYRTPQTVCGTQKYMAPEVRHQKPQDHTVDAWNLGLVLRELFSRTGVCSDDAQDLVAALTRRNPRERMEIEDALHHPFFAEADRTADSGHITMSSPIAAHLQTPPSLPMKGRDPLLRSKLMPARNIVGSPVTNSSTHFSRTQDRIKVTPLNTTRILPTSLNFGRYQCHLLENGSVRYEWLRDGVVTKTVEFSPENVKHLHKHAKPTVYSYHDLPRSLSTPYKQAEEFIEACRRKTIKICLKTRDADCKLFEDLEYFYVKFHGGGRIMKDQQDVTVAIPGKRKLCLKWDLMDTWPTQFAHDQDTLHRLRLFEKYYNHCLKTERALAATESLDRDIPSSFPLQLGSEAAKPKNMTATHSDRHWQNGGSVSRHEDRSARSVTRSPSRTRADKRRLQSPSLSSSSKTPDRIAKIGDRRRLQSPSLSLSNRAPGVIVKTTYVPDLGKVSQCVTGEIAIEYEGSRTIIFRWLPGGNIVWEGMEDDTRQEQVQHMDDVKRAVLHLKTEF